MGIIENRIKKALVPELTKVFEEKFSEIAGQMDERNAVVREENDRKLVDALNKWEQEVSDTARELIRDEFERTVTIVVQREVEAEFRRRDRKARKVVQRVF